jgi:hypothetical protein
MPKANTSTLNATPDLMPVLSPGKHRNPRQGACFMEFASYLAGERWSDHPVCTHPLLAFLARGVNDFSSDEARSRLVPLIPSVIGLTGTDARIDVAIAVRSASCAIPIASESRQRALATGLLTCLRAAEDLGETRDDPMIRRIHEALALAPLATRWAEEFEGLRGNHKRSLSFTRAGRAIVSTAVLGISQACINDADERLHELLSLAIADTADLLGANVAVPTEPQVQPQQEQVSLVH